MKVEIVSEGRNNTSIKLDGKEFTNVKSLIFNCEACKIPMLTMELYVNNDTKLHVDGYKE